MTHDMTITLQYFEMWNIYTMFLSNYNYVSRIVMYFGICKNKFTNTLPMYCTRTGTISRLAPGQWIASENVYI